MWRYRKMWTITKRTSQPLLKKKKKRENRKKRIDSELLYSLKLVDKEFKTTTVNEVSDIKETMDIISKKMENERI